MTIRTLIAAGLFAATLAAPAFAQNSTTNTQSPPSPNASSQMPEPTNSLPPGAGNTVGNRAGSSVGTSAPTAGDATAPSNSAGTTTSVPPPAIR